MLRESIYNFILVMLRSMLLLPFLFLLVTCNPPAPTPGENLIVEGVNLTQLFEPPTSNEVNAVRADWAGRSYPVKDFQVVAT